MGRSTRNTNFKLRKLERQQKVRTMVCLGYPDRQIATQLNISLGTVAKDVREVYERAAKADPVESAITKHMAVERYQELLALVAPHLTLSKKRGKKTVDTPQLDVLDRFLKIQARIDLIEGNEAPQKVQHSGSLDFNKLRERNAQLENESVNVPEAALGNV